MRKVTDRLEQEVSRLGGNYAHVLSESADSKHNDVTNEASLHGAFTYVVCRRPSKPSKLASPP